MAAAFGKPQTGAISIFKSRRFDALSAPLRRRATGTSRCSPLILGIGAEPVSAGTPTLLRAFTGVTDPASPAPARR